MSASMKRFMAIKCQDGKIRWYWRKRKARRECTSTKKKKDLGFVPKKNTFVESITFSIKAVFDVTARSTAEGIQ